MSAGSSRISETRGPAHAAPVGVAVWGVGDHARRNLLPAIAGTSAVRLVGVWSRDSAVREAEATRHGCRAFPSESVMLADPAVEAVVVATPPGLHREHGLAVLSAGKHLWCEKPLSHRLDDAAALIDESRKRERALIELVAYQRHPQFVRLRALIADGAIGQVRSLVARFGFPHMRPENIRYRPELGGGALADNGFYPISAALAILTGEPVTVSARIGADPGYAVDTFGAALIGFASGETAILEWAFGRHYRNEIELWGETGSIFVMPAFSKPATIPPRIVVRTQAGERTVEIEPANQFVAVIERAAATIRDPGRWQGAREDALARARLTAQIAAAGR